MSTEESDGGLHNRKEAQQSKGNLNPEEQQVILDCYFKTGNEENIARGLDLVAKNPKAAKLYANLEDTLVGLDDLKYEPCPENMAEANAAQRLNLDEQGYGLYTRKEGKELKLAMQSLWLSGQVNSFGARLLVSHVLKSSETEPIEAVYSFILPRDGTLRRFYITGDGFFAHSELRPTQQAQEEYERGIEAGHLSAFSKIYKDGVVNLNVGNIRPNETITVHLEILAGVESHHNGFRFRFPFTLAPTYHAQAKMINCEEGQGEIELPEKDFGDVILPVFMKDSDNLHKIGFNVNIDFPHNDIQIASPSHNIQTSYQKKSIIKASLALRGDVPNRDLILDVHSKEPVMQIHKGIDATGQTSFICSVPSTEFGETTQEQRKFVFLLDRSGSMRGEPLRQAKNALGACISALTEKDYFSLVAFDTSADIFDALVHGTKDIRSRAESFLEKIDARGGTDMLHGIRTASSIFGGNSGDIMIITDGQVSGTEKIIQHAKSLSVRLHILGIGSASQDRFFASLARETGGTSKFVTPRERIDLVALNLFSEIGRPVATDLKVKLIGTTNGQIEPEIASQVYENSSLQIFGHFDHKDTPQLLLEWKTQGQQKTKEYSLAMENNTNGNTLRLIRGSRLITDYENKQTTFPARTGSGMREEKRIMEWLGRLSTEYGLSSSQMSLVAVVEREGDRTGILPKTIVVPVGMPQDVEFTSYFDRTHADAAQTITHARMKGFGDTTCGCLIRPIENPRIAVLEFKNNSVSLKYKNDIDELIQLAIKLEPDGGMPGDTIEQRIEGSLTALIEFIKEGNTTETGPYRLHVKKLVDFLTKHFGHIQEGQKRTIVHAAIEKLNQLKFEDNNMKEYAMKTIVTFIEQ